MRQLENSCQDLVLAPEGLAFSPSGIAPALVPQQGNFAPILVRTFTIAAALLAVAFLTSCNGRTILTDDIEKPPKPMFSETRVFFVHERNGTLSVVPVVRRIRTKTAIHDAVSELLNGPSKQEEGTGLASEIPRGTILIGVHENADEVDLNLSRRFASDAGASSLETRLEQLRRTVEESAGKRKVYLDVEGKRLSTASGEGLEIKQPINM